MGLEFHFSGQVLPSKSELIRALCLKSWNKDITFDATTNGKDVQNTALAVESFYNGKTNFFCGDSALMLRLFSARLSRLKGEFSLTGSERLFERPHNPLWNTLALLGCNLSQSETELKINSAGWNEDKAHVFIESFKSSQYLSALILNSWQLKSDITWDYSTLASAGYLNLTLNLLEKVGLEFAHEQNKIHIRKLQTPKTVHLEIEPDMSTAFTIAAWAATGGSAEIKNFPLTSHQPDFVFTEILKNLGVKIDISDQSKTHQTLLVKKAKTFNPINANLLNSPDLFPVLSMLCAFADGVSVLKNVAHTADKESNRIKKTQELLSALGRESKFSGTDFTIYGDKSIAPKTFSFNPDQDHRMVMAAHLLKLMGYNIEILNANVINKTAPELLSYVC